MTAAPGALPSAPVAISVVVPCYDRIALLERTLLACFAQIVPAGIGWEIIVADNHVEQRAAPLVSRLQSRSPVPLLHVVAPPRNIAAARNAGVLRARGAFVAFVDDDEAPTPYWLDSLYASLQRTHADAAFGPKYPVFEGGRPPFWDPLGWFYTTDYQLAADAPIQMFGRLRPRGRAIGTGNSMMRVATCFSGPPPFDEVLGETGGEDTDLFFRLLTAGRRFVWCPAGIVQEFMEAPRLQFDYIRLRLMRGSQIYARFRVRNSSRPLLTRAKVSVIGLAQLVVHGSLLLISGEILTSRRVRHRIGLAKGLGKLTSPARGIGFIAETR